MRKIVLIVALITASGCATIDTFNKTSANIVRDAITANEQNRCTVHAQPCLSDAQFRAVAASLNKVSVAGSVFTDLRSRGKATIQDVNTFLTTLTQESTTLSQTFGTTGAIGKVLAQLIKLQGKVNNLMNKMPPPVQAAP